jgi:hypothetical protein
VEKLLRRVRDWRDARKGAIRHASALKEFLTVVKWNEYDQRQKPYPPCSE